VNSLPKTVTRQRRHCDLNPGPSATESSTLTTCLPSHFMTLWPHTNLFIIVVAVNRVVRFQEDLLSEWRPGVGDGAGKSEQHGAVLRGTASLHHPAFTPAPASLQLHPQPLDFRLRPTRRHLHIDGAA